MMLCPCDSVGLHDHYAISLVGGAAVLGVGAAILVFRLMRRDSGDTAFFKAFVAITVTVVAIYAELFLSMQVVAWLARTPR